EVVRQRELPFTAQRDPAVSPRERCTCASAYGVLRPRPASERANGQAWRGVAKVHRSTRAGIEPLHAIIAQHVAELPRIEMKARRARCLPVGRGHVVK